MNFHEARISLSLKRVAIKSDHRRLGGDDPSGRRIDSTNNSWRRDGRPWFAITGEMHYSRGTERFWDRELGKMKAGGVQVVTTYVFWNYHEEVRGETVWTGRRNLRRFVELCQKNALWVVARIGPFCHGEVRNGGLPDWLYGQDFEVRSNDPGYLTPVAHWYRQIGAQLRGLLWKDGGPVIGTQIENEYQHSSAPWEMTVGTTNEWLPPGRDGDAHMLTLKRLAREAGIDTPLYLATAWGGASAPPGEMLPLSAGYSYQPWLFNDPRTTEHPPTSEYLFRDGPSAFEEAPYAFGELGGGMFVSYRYRFQFAPAAVPAMAVVKVASGANVLGYYMYHGGTNLRGFRQPFLNENTTPKVSYDFQAILGEGGQLRAHYHDLRLLHLFLDQCGEALCGAVTTLPPGAETLRPDDPHTLRWAVRSDGVRGFLFVSNYQDHFALEPKTGVAFQLDFEDPSVPSVRIPATGGIPLARDQFAIFPFHQDLDGLDLVSATAQMVGRVEVAGEPWWFFFAPRGIPSRFQLGQGRGELRAEGTEDVHWALAVEGSLVHLVVLPEAQARDLYQVTLGDQTVLLLSNASVRTTSSPEGPTLVLEYPSDLRPTLSAFPPLAGAPGSEGRLFTPYPLDLADSDFQAPELRTSLVGDRQARVSLPSDLPPGFEDLILVIDYDGDVGHASIDGHLVHDNFCNQAPWEISLATVHDDVPTGAWGRDLVISIVPRRPGAGVVYEPGILPSQGEDEVGVLRSIRTKAVRSWRGTFPNPVEAPTSGQKKTPRSAKA